MASVTAHRRKLLVARLRRWLQIVERQVTWMLVNRVIFKDTLEIVRHNPETHKPADFVNWFTEQYRLD